MIKYAAKHAALLLFFTALPIGYFIQELPWAVNGETVSGEVIGLATEDCQRTSSGEGGSREVCTYNAPVRFATPDGDLTRFVAFSEPVETGVVVDITYLPDNPSEPRSGRVSSGWPIAAGVLGFGPWLIFPVRLLREARERHRRRWGLD